MDGWFVGWMQLVEHTVDGYRKTHRAAGELGRERSRSASAGIGMAGGDRAVAKRTLWVHFAGAALKLENLHRVALVALHDGDRRAR